MNIARRYFFRFLLLTAIAFSSTAAAGPVILMGIDAEDDNPPGHGGTAPYISVLNSLLAAVTNGNSGLLVIGGGKDPGTPDDVTNFWNIVGGSLTEPITFVNSAAAIATIDFSGFAAIAVVSDVGNTPDGGLTNDENNALAARSGEVADFVNAGGGLFGLSSEGFDAPFGYVAGLGGVSVTPNPNYDNVTATPEGNLIGIDDTNLDVDAWHNTFLTFPSFLEVLATVDVCDEASGGSGIYECDEVVGNAAAIGGATVTIVPGTSLFDPRQPGSALVYPLFDVNNDPGNARSTTIKLSNLGTESVWVHLVRVCGGIKSWGAQGLCQASNRQVKLTPGETFVRDVAGFFSIDRDNCPTGYIVAYAQMGEIDKTPMVWNHLIGSVHMNSSGPLNQRTSGMQAYGFQAYAEETCNGDLTSEVLCQNRNGHPSQDGLPVAGASGGAQPVLPFDGLGYAAPATSYSTDYLATIGQRYTELTLLTLDIEAGFQNPPTVVALDAWNQKEEYYSGAIEYVCHVRVRLDDEINAAQPGAGVQAGLGFGRAASLGSQYGLLQMTPLTNRHAILGATVQMGGNRQTMRGLWHDDKLRPTTFYAR